MKILFINGLFPKKNNEFGGIFIINRLKHLREFNIDFECLNPVGIEDKVVKTIKKLLKLPLSEEEVFIGIKTFGGVSQTFLPFKITILHYLKKSKDPSRLIYKSIASHIKNNKLKFDLIHSHVVYPHGWIGMKISDEFRIPYLITAHGSDVNLYMNQNKTILKKSLNALERAGKVIFVSQALLNKAKSYGYSGKNAVVISNGYDPKIFYPMNKELVRKELGIYKENAYYVGFIGNLIEVKRADKLPEIFHLMAKKVKNIKFIVVGDGLLRPKIEKEAKDLDIIFTGRIPQQKVAKWMNAMDVMILPSKNEGWPCVVLEAQACGTAVVGSSNGGIPEAIGFDKFVVEEGEEFEKRLADKVIEILKDGYDPKILLERAKDYTWENIVRKEIEIYKEALNK